MIFLPSKKIAIVTRLKITFWNPIDNMAPTIVSLPDCIDPDKQEVALLSGPRPYPLNTISKDCNIAASRLEDGSIAVWMVESRTVNYILVGDSIPDHMGGGIQSIAFSPDNKFIASGNTNGKVQVWNIEDMD